MNIKLLSYNCSLKYLFDVYFLFYKTNDGLMQVPVLLLGNESTKAAVLKE